MLAVGAANGLEQLFVAAAEAALIRFDGKKVKHMG